MGSLLNYTYPWTPSRLPLKEVKSIRSHRLVVSILAMLTCACAHAVDLQTAPAPRRPVLRVVAHAVGGAVVGSWAGYLASQVAWSDWRQDPGRGAQRVRFTVAGGAVGLLMGALIGHQGHQQVLAEPLLSAPVERLAPGGPITTDEIRASSARTLTELLRRLRPQWLRTRGQDVVRSGADQPARHGLQVYLNGHLLGGLNSLEQVSIDTVTGVEFIEPGAAVLRWGVGNEDGAILISTYEAP